MKIDCIADLHGFYPKLEGGDLLIVAGDLTARDEQKEHREFAFWMQKQGYKTKILIGGNHDGRLQMLSMPGKTLFFPTSESHYLFDSGTEVEGFKVWGSPWTPTFCDWHFMLDRGDPIKAKWDLIPDDTEILITHGPPFGIQDETQDGELVGCEELRNALSRLKKLKLHVFGHVHECYGMVQVNGVIHVNASVVNEHYKHVNKPIRIEL